MDLWFPKIYLKSRACNVKAVTTGGDRRCPALLTDSGARSHLYVNFVLKDSRALILKMFEKNVPKIIGYVWIWKAKKRIHKILYWPHSFCDIRLAICHNFSGDKRVCSGDKKGMGKIFHRLMLMAKICNLILSICWNRYGKEGLQLSSWLTKSDLFR